MWWWLVVPVAAIYLNGWMIEQYGRRGADLNYAAVWLVASALTTFGHAPLVVRWFCLSSFVIMLMGAPVSQRGNLQSVLSVSPFHTPAVKWTMAAAGIVLILW